MTLTAMPAAGNAVRWWFALLVLCLALLAPLTIADVPPLLDYPNHLARLYVLAVGPHDPILSRFFEPRWGIIPNLALDLTVPPLLRVFPVHLVGRAVVAVILLLPVFGAVAYHRALSGRLWYWPLGSVLFVYNAALLRGFLNFIASVGLALLFAAVWAAWRERRPFLAILTTAVGAVVLFFCHLTGLLFFAILIGGHELAALVAMREKQDMSPAMSGDGEGYFQSWTTFLASRETLSRIAACLAVFVVPAILYAVSDLSGMQGDARFRTIEGKAHAALIPVINYLWPLDLLTVAFCIAVPALCLATRRCTIPFQAAVAIVAMLILFVGSPVEFKGTNDVDTRCIVMAAFTIAGSIVPIALPRSAARAIGILFLLLITVRMTVLAMAWVGWAADLTAFRAIIAPIQPGDLVMTYYPSREDRPYSWRSIAPAGQLSDGTVTHTHLPGLLVIEHRAFWPFLFDNLSQQPIKKREPYRTAFIVVDNSPDPIALLARRSPETRLFTHVLVLGPDPATIDTNGLRLLGRNGMAALYTVVRDPISEEPPRAPPPGH